MTLAEVRRRAWSRYVIPLVSVGLAFAVRTTFLSSLEDRAPFVTFYPAVIVAALAGGFRGGLMAAVLSAVAVDISWMPPASFGISAHADWLAEAAFVLGAAGISWLAGAMQSAQARAAKAEAHANIAEERARSEEDLRRYRLLSEHARDIILHIRRDDGHILEANAAASEAYGYSRAELQGLTIHEVRARDARALTEIQLAQADAGGIVFETTHRRKDGSTFPVEVSSRGADIGGTRTLISVVRDITERKQAEGERQRLAAELAERVAELQAILDAAPVAVWIAHDPECRRITGNAFADRLMHAERGGNVSPGADSAERAVSYKVFRNGVELRVEELPNQAAAATGEPVREEEYTLVFSDGRTVHLLLGAVPLFDAAGRPRGSVCAGIDITRRRRAERGLRESESILRAFFDSAGVMRGIVELAGDDVIHVSCNQAAADMYGADRASIAGKSARQTGATEEVMRTSIALYRESEQSGRPATAEYGRRDAKGVERWLLATTSYLGIGSSGSPRFAYTILDLTERKRAEEALERQRQWLRVTLTSIGDAVLATDEEGHITFLNPVAARLTGWTEEEALGQRGADVLRIVPEGGGPVDDIVARVLREGRLLSVANHSALVTRDGREIPIEDSAAPIRDGAGNLLGVVVVCHDVAEQRRARQALRESEALLRALGDNLPEGVLYRYCEDAGGRASFEFMSAGIEALTGIAASEFMADVGMIAKTVLPEDYERMRAAIQVSRERLAPFEIEVRRRHRRTGEVKWSLLRSTPVRRPDGTTVWDGIELDITARKRVEEALRENEAALRESEARHRRLVDLAPEAILVQQDGRIVYCNDSAARLYGAPDRDALIGTGMFDRIHPEDLPAVQERIRASISGVRIPVREARHLRLDGTEIAVETTAGPVEWHGRPAMLVFVRDIGDRKRAEARLRDSQKFESLGILAGGVAHDFNNLLIGVIGNASLALEELPPEHPAVELLTGVLKSGQQAAHLTRQMLAYSGKGRFIVEVLDLSVVVPEIGALIRTSVPKKIDLRFETPAPATIEADRGQLQQILMNLAINAAEAIGGGEGAITVRTGTLEVDEPFRKRHPEASGLAGPHVYLEVRDTGCGMDEEVKAKVFDPFFSTKFTGRGLGLAAVAGIVRGHKGAIAVESAPGQGSTFTVLFPAAGRSAAPAPPAGHPASLAGSGTILVVDDEPTVRDMVKRSLEAQGYTVLRAESGPAAIEIARRYAAEIALTLLDLSMPHMSGAEVVPQLRKLRPEMKIVVSSGYGETETMVLFEGHAVSGFVQKPYTAAGIAEKIKLYLS